jgi:two-component system, LuxR family, response regulator FixJ
MRLSGPGFFAGSQSPRTFASPPEARPTNTRSPFTFQLLPSPPLTLAVDGLSFSLYDGGPKVPRMNMHRILVLDDDIGVCTVLSRILQDRYDVYTSQSVVGAAETLAEKSFDAYLLDYRLADGTGLQVAEKVRQQGITAPIILISGYGATDIAAKAITLDIFEVLQKPFTREAICNSLERALNHALRKPSNSLQPTTEMPVPAPTGRVRFTTLQVVLIAAALLFVALCIFLMFH